MFGCLVGDAVGLSLHLDGRVQVSLFLHRPCKDVVLVEVLHVIERNGRGLEPADERVIRAAGDVTLVGGGGGGRDDSAQAGGKDPSKIDEALGAVEGIVREALGS